MHKQYQNKARENKKCSTSMATLISLLIVATSTLTIITEAQTPSCAEKLIPCAAYMNSTTPPASCCTPLKQAVEQELQCLCNLYNTPGLLQSFGVNVTQALQLPGYCKISGDLSACSKLSSPSPTSTTPPAGEVAKDSNGSNKMAWTGLSGILLFWASMMIY